MVEGVAGTTDGNHVLIMLSYVDGATWAVGEFRIVVEIYSVMTNALDRENALFVLREIARDAANQSRVRLAGRRFELTQLRSFAPIAQAMQIPAEI